MKKRLRGGRFGETAFGQEGVNPMDGVANLADVMLVLACGLMLALVINWDVDISPKADGGAGRAKEVEQEVELSGEQGEKLDEASLEDMGRVYRDTTTGKWYLVSDG